MELELLPNGTRIVKCHSKPGDGHANGASGVVVHGFMVPEELMDDTLESRSFYFVVWDDFPLAPVGIAGHRIKRA